MYCCRSERFTLNGVWGWDKGWSGGGMGGGEGMLINDIYFNINCSFVLLC